MRSPAEAARAPGLFGTDGIRGLAGRWPLTAEFARRVGFEAGRAIGGRRRTLLIVRDTRRSGPALQKALAGGFSAAGWRVLDGGVLPTPAVAALVPRHGFGAGAVVSASHNTAEFNGIKFFGPGGAKLAEPLERRVETALARPGAAPRGGRPATPYPRAAADYLRFLRSAWPAGVDLRGVDLVIDCANGATARVAAPLFRGLGARVTVLSDRPDGLNINRGCGALHPERLVRAVRRRRADLGVAFDGDGDRAMFVDDAGEVRDGDSVLLVAARHLKAGGRLPRDLVVATVMANLGFHRALAALGVRATETPVGDKYVGLAMAKSGAALGGEQSGHVIFREFLPTGDGLLTALQVLRAMRETARPFSALASLVVKYPQVLLNMRVREKRPLGTLRAFRRDVESVRRALDGMGRVLVRYSGTEPLLRIMVEGPDAAVVRRHAEALAASVRREGV